MIVNPSQILIGDWVRFFQNGRMVIGVVQYLPTKDDRLGCFKVMTDVGTVSVDSVLEHRRRT